MVLRDALEKIAVKLEPLGFGIVRVVAVGHEGRAPDRDSAQGRPCLAVAPTR